jgi:hypothetical protein
VLFKISGKTLIYNRIRNIFMYFNGIKFYTSDKVLYTDNLQLPDNLNYNIVDDKKTITCIKNGTKKYLSVNIDHKRYNNNNEGWAIHNQTNIILIDTIDILSSWTIKINDKDNSYYSIMNDITGRYMDYGRNDEPVYLNNDFDPTNDNMKWIFYEDGSGNISI